MKIRISIVVFSLLFGSFLSIGQVRIKMQKDGGVYKIPCVVNGLKLKFIFDTGASNVCISLSEANLMLDNGYLDKKDIIGKGQAQIADGSIIDNTRIILREIKINDLILKDVEAVVVHELTAPLLLGQSAIEKLGKIQIEGDEMIVLNAKGNNYTDIEISEMFTQAVLNSGDKMYIAAADTFQKIYDMQRLGEMGILYLADTYLCAKNYTKALKYYLEVLDKPLGETKEEIDENKFSILSNMATCFYNMKDYSQAELFNQKSKQYAKTDYQNYCFSSSLVDIYVAYKNYDLMKNNIYLSLNYLAKYKGYSYNDILNGKAKNEDISSMLSLYGLYLINCGFKSEGKGMMCLSAKYGDKRAIDYSKSNNLDYNKYSWVSP